MQMEFESDGLKLSNGDTVHWPEIKSVAKEADTVRIFTDGRIYFVKCLDDVQALCAKRAIRAMMACKTLDEAVYFYECFRLATGESAEEAYKGFNEDQ